MEARKMMGFLCFLVHFWLCYYLSATTSLLRRQKKGVNYEVQALMDIKAFLKDPLGVLDNWDRDSVDPCIWETVTCSSENLVIALQTQNQSLSGTLSSSIGNLTNLQYVLLQNNNVSGRIPEDLISPTTNSPATCHLQEA